ncbi:MAG: hypothetical protein ACR2GH_03435 [Pseudonocardia sp.]
MNQTLGVGVGVETHIGLHVGYKEPVSLRLNADGGAYLDLGSDVEIVLAQAHLSVLHEQSATVLAELVALDNAEDQVVTAQAVGEQAASIAEQARQDADRALATGAEQQAHDARAAADRAADAAALVQNTVQAALDAMRTAEEAMEAAGKAAAAARETVAAVDGGTDGSSGRTLRLA